jgi:hypothetical protein
MLATEVVPSVVGAILLVFLESVPDSDLEQRLGAALLGLVLVSATIIVGQWLVLRTQIPRAGSWVLAGIGALMVGSVVGLVAGVLAAAFTRALGADLAFGLGVGLGVGAAVGTPLALVTITIAQWLVLRRHVSRAGFWLLVPIVSVLVSLMVGSVVDLVAGGAAAGEVVKGSLHTVLYGAVSGGVMVWLLRQPAEKEIGSQL